MFFRAWIAVVVTFAQMTCCICANAQDQAILDKPRERSLADGYCRTHPAFESSDPVAELRSIQKMFDDNSVAWVEIIYPKSIGRGYYQDFLDLSESYRLKVPVAREEEFGNFEYLFGGYGVDLRDVIQSERVALYEGMVHLRSGIIFFDVHRLRVGGVYFDETGEYGTVNCRAVRFLHKRKLLWLFGKPNLYDWMMYHFSSVFTPGFSDDRIKSK